MTTYANTPAGLAAALAEVSGDATRLWFDSDKIITIPTPVINDQQIPSAPGLVSDLLSAISTIGASQAEITLTGSITISASVTSPPNISIRVQKGASITVASGVTLKIKGPFQAGNYVIFSGAGAVDFNEGSRHHNLAWYAGNSINEKWDFCRRGLKNLFPYTAHIPHPADGDPAATFQYKENGASKLWFWKLTAPIYFDDPENRGEWTIDGHIQAQNAVHSMFYFSPYNKCEDVTFRTDVLLDGNGVAERGVYCNGGARIKFPSQLYVVGCATAVHVRAELPVGNIFFDDLYVGSFSNAAAIIESAAVSVNGVKIAVHCEIALNENCYGVKLIGDCRYCEVKKLDYASGEINDLLVGVYVESNATQGSTRAGMVIGPIIGNTIKTGFMCRAPSGGGRAYNVEVGPIFPGPDYRAGVVAADVQNMSSSIIKSGAYFYPVYLDYNTVRVSLIAPNHNGVVDHGSYNSVNGIIRVSLATGDMPDIALTKFGDIIVDLASGRTWLKISDTGTGTTDFVQLK